MQEARLDPKLLDPKLLDPKLIYRKEGLPVGRQGFK
jgi:hypothetical protein